MKVNVEKKLRDSHINLRPLLAHAQIPTPHTNTWRRKMNIYEGHESRKRAS